ncbi:tetratricopeptide repeat protein [Candidatus Moduliflexota bacterium]
MGVVGAAFLAALLAFLVFSGTLPYDLVWDDPILIENVDRHYRQGGLTGLLMAEFNPDRNTDGPMNYYRPVVHVSLWLDSRLAGLVPWSYHLTNVLLHSLNSALVFFLASQLLPSVLPAALAGALIFAVHPVHVESVAFVSGRTDLVATVFVLLSMLAWARHRTRQGPERKLLIAASAAAYLLGALSKETVFLLPAIPLLWDLTEERAGAGTGGTWRKRNLPWAASWSAAILVVGPLRWAATGVVIGMSEQTAVATQPTLLNASLMVKVWISYMKLMTVPWPLRAFYMPSSVNLSALSLVGAGVFLGLSLAASVRSCRYGGLLGLWWFALFLIPVSGFIPLQAAAMAERFLYLPSVGFCLIVACAFSRALHSSPSRLLASAACGAVVIVFFSLAVMRAPVWRNTFTLFSDMTEHIPDYPGAHINLGTHYELLGEPDRAASHFRQAIRIEPGNAKANYNLGNFFLQQGKLEKALNQYETALRSNPDYFLAHNNMGIALLRLKRPGEALKHYTAASDLRPDALEPHFNMGSVLSALGRHAEAERSYRKALAIAPDNLPVLAKLGLCLFEQGKFEEAISPFAEILRLDPGNSFARENLHRARTAASGGRAP